MEFVYSSIMRVRHYRGISIGMAVIALSTTSRTKLAAQQFGPFSYKIVGDSVEITSYSKRAVGPHRSGEGGTSSWSQGLAMIDHAWLVQRNDHP